MKLQAPVYRGASMRFGYKIIGACIPNISNCFFKYYYKQGEKISYFL